MLSIMSPPHFPCRLEQLLLVVILSFLNELGVGGGWERLVGRTCRAGVKKRINTQHPRCDVKLGALPGWSTNSLKDFDSSGDSGLAARPVGTAQMIELGDVSGPPPPQGRWLS